MKQILIFGFILSVAILHAQQDTVWNQINDRGEKTGWWKSYALDGVLQYKGFFKEGEPVGRFVRYFDDGETAKIIQYFDESSDSVKTKMFYGDGSLASEGVFVNKKKEGLWVSYSYYSNAKMIEEYYKNGELHGEQKKFYENGQIHQIIAYEDGIKHGKWLQFFPDGAEKMKAEYKNGSASGRYVSYFPNGDVKMKGAYKNGLKEGVWYVYDEEGSLISDMEYKAGIPVDLEKIEQQEQEFFRKQEEKAKELQEPRDMIY